MQALHATPRARHTAIGSRPGVCERNLRVALCCVCRMRCIEYCRVNFALCRVDAAGGFEPRHVRDVIGINQPIPGRHRCAVVEQRCIAHDAR